jgi:hypothetical protein
MDHSHPGITRLPRRRGCGLERSAALSGWQSARALVILINEVPPHGFRLHYAELLGNASGPQCRLMRFSQQIADGGGNREQLGILAGKARDLQPKRQAIY